MPPPTLIPSQRPRSVRDDPNFEEVAESQPLRRVALAPKAMLAREEQTIEDSVSDTAVGSSEKCTCTDDGSQCDD